MTVASAGPYANNLHLTPDRQPHEHLVTQFFKGWMLFLTHNQQCQSTEGKYLELKMGPFERGHIMCAQGIDTLEGYVFRSHMHAD